MQNTKQMDFQFDIKSIDKQGAFSGYASVFDMIDQQNDLILKGAFQRTLEERGSDIKLLWQHKTDEPIGVFASLREDSHGLFVEGKLLLEVQRAGEAYALLKSGAINGMSIGYSVTHADYNKNGIRMISEIELYEVSLVTFPANESATITSVKGILPQTTREFEYFLRESGFSRSQAKSFALRGFKQGDADADLLNSLDRVIELLR
jgi:HK97 family phage prohead protease